MCVHVCALIYGVCVCVVFQSESSVESLHRTIRSLEHKLGVAQGELSSAQIALSQSQQEYEQYKVKQQSQFKITRNYQTVVFCVIHVHVSTHTHTLVHILHAKCDIRVPLLRL